MVPKWVSYVGDFEAGSTFLSSKEPFSLWLIVLYLDALARSFGQVVFANNPFSGVLVIVALFAADPVIAGAGIFTASIALITVLILELPRDTISAGLTSFCGVLVGTVATSLVPFQIHDRSYYLFWLGLSVGAILSVYLTSAISNILGSLNPPLPCLTLPFNVVTYAVIICLKVHEASYLGVSSDDNTVINTTNNSDVEWQKVLLGTLLSSGQVYAVNDVVASSLIYLALIIFSPLLAVMSYIGAFFGTMTGCLILRNQGYSSSYIGLLGYNSLLSAGAVGGFFYVFTWRSAITAVLCSIFTSLIQAGLQIFLNRFELPVLTMPFVIATSLFLAVVRKNVTSLVRPRDLTFPEMHCITNVDNTASTVERGTEVSSNTSLESPELCESVNIDNWTDNQIYSPKLIKTT